MEAIKLETIINNLNNQLIVPIYIFYNYVILDQS